jgi:hypothetical protein
MSFVKKTIKKTWNFVKNHWKEIAIVAAIAFTAGVATIGFSAFAGGNFFAAVGSTMWAGVAGTAGTMGIGSGAVVGAGGMTAAGGTAVAAGTHVGLGAAWGAGAGAGWGAGSKIAAANMEIGTVNAAAAGEAAAVAEAAEGGMTLAPEAAKEAGMTAAKKYAAENATKASVAALEGGGGGAGLSDTAWKAMGAVAPIVGAGLMAAGAEEKYHKTDLYASTPDGPARAGINMLADPTGGGGTQVAGAGGGEGAVTGADQEMQGQLNRPNESIMRPLMGVQGQRGLDGRLQEQYV